MLKALGLRTRGVNIIACPSCARQGFDVIRTVEALEARLAHISEPISLSIIGCVVNGPGEAAYTDLGFTGGGKGAGMLYFAGQQSEKSLQRDHDRTHCRGGRGQGGEDARGASGPGRSGIDGRPVPGSRFTLRHSGASRNPVFF